MFKLRVSESKAIAYSLYSETRGDDKVPQLVGFLERLFVDFFLHEFAVNHFVFDAMRL